MRKTVAIFVYEFEHRGSVVLGNFTLSKRGGFCADDINNVKREIANFHRSSGYSDVTKDDIIILSIIPLPVR